MDATKWFGQDKPKEKVWLRASGKVDAQAECERRKLIKAMTKKHNPDLIGKWRPPVEKDWTEDLKEKQKQSLLRYEERRRARIDSEEDAISSSRSRTESDIITTVQESANAWGTPEWENRSNKIPDEVMLKDNIHPCDKMKRLSSGKAWYACGSDSTFSQSATDFASSEFVIHDSLSTSSARDRWFNREQSNETKSKPEKGKEKRIKSSLSLFCRSHTDSSALMAERAILVGSFGAASKESFIDQEIRETAEREEMWKKEKLKKDDKNQAVVGDAQDARKNEKPKLEVLSKPETDHSELSSTVDQVVADDAAVSSERAPVSLEDNDKDIQKGNDIVDQKDESLETIQSALTVQDKEHLSTKEGVETVSTNLLLAENECEENLANENKSTAFLSNHEVLPTTNMQKEARDPLPSLIEEEAIVPVKIPRKLVTDNIKILENENMISDDTSTNDTTESSCHTSCSVGNEVTTSTTANDFNFEGCASGEEPNDEESTFEKTAFEGIDTEQQPNGNCLTDKIISSKQCLMEEVCNDGAGVVKGTALTKTILLKEDCTEKPVTANSFEKATTADNALITENIVEKYSADKSSFKETSTDEALAACDSSKETSTLDRNADKISINVSKHEEVDQHDDGGGSEAATHEMCEESTEQVYKNTPSVMSQTPIDLSLAVSPRGWGSKPVTVSPVTPKLKFKPLNTAPSVDAKADMDTAKASSNNENTADVAKENSIEETREIQATPNEHLSIDRNNSIPHTGNVRKVIVMPQRSGPSFEVVSSKSRQHTIMQLEIEEAQLREQEWRQKQNLARSDNHEINRGNTVSTSHTKVEIVERNSVPVAEAKSTCARTKVEECSARKSEEDLGVSKELIEKITAGGSSQHQKKTVVDANRVTRRKSMMAQRWEAGKFKNNEDS